MRRISAVSILIILIAMGNQGLAQITQKNSWDRYNHFIIENLKNEVWPEYWSDWHQKNVYHLKDPEVIKDLDERGLDLVQEAAKEVIIDELKHWGIYQQFHQELEDFSKMNFSIHYQGLAGETETKKLTLDAGFTIRKSEGRIINAGLRFKRQPAIFLSYDWLNDGKINHDWSWYPLRDRIEYRLDKMPWNLDMKFVYNYQDQKVGWRSRNWKITGPWHLALGADYHFNRHDYYFKGLIYAAF